MRATPVKVQNARNGGGTYADGYPWRIVIHEIQGNDSLGMIASHPYPPHWWYDPISRDLHETVPLGRSAFALYQYPSSSTMINKGRALQVEVAGFTGYQPDETDQMLRNIAQDVVVPMVEFARSQGGDIDLTEIRPIVSLTYAAREDWAGRMTDAEWRTFNGVCGHMHVPHNDHWDPGAMDLARICKYAAELLEDLGGSGTVDPPPTTGDDDLTPAQAEMLERIDRAIGHPEWRVAGATNGYDALGALGNKVAWETVGPMVRKIVQEELAKAGVVPQVPVAAGPTPIKPLASMAVHGFSTQETDR